MKHLLFFLLALTATGCDPDARPLDAEDRLFIDSVSAAQIRTARLEIDSLCREAQKTELPRLIDSLRRERLREIQEKMKTIPR